MKTIKEIMKIAIVLVITAIGNVNAQSGTNPQLESIAWKFKTSGEINATPIILNDVLYVGSYDSCFYAVDLKTKTEKWRYKTGDKIYTTAVICEGIICFESGNILYGLNLNGNLEWKFTLYEGSFVNQHDEWDYYHSSPTVGGATVYIGSEKGLVFGVDAKTGSKVFQCQTPTAEFTIETTPLIYEDKIYFGDWDGVFFAYNLSTGNKVWQYDTKNDLSHSGWVNAIVTDPIMFEGNIYFGGRSCNLYCVDPQTGAKKWMYHDSGNMWMLGGPTIADSTLFIGSSYQHIVHSFNAITGKQNWKTGVEYRANGKPMIDGDYVYVGTEHDTDKKIGTLCAINRRDGDLKVKIKVGGQIYSTPVLYDGKIYFGCTDGCIYVVDQNQFINTPYPDTYLKESIIDLGKIQNTGSYSTVIYIHNKGELEDSVTVQSQFSQLKAEPRVLKIAPKDSQEVKLTFDFRTLTAKKYTVRVMFTSNLAITLKKIPQTITFELEEVTGISSDIEKPVSYSLCQNYPNPFNPETSIKYQIPLAGNVNIKVYDSLGREVATLVNKEQSAGNYEVKFNGNNLSSGIYFYRIKSGGFEKTNKMLLLK